MTWESFDDKCDGCQPAIIDMRTGKRLPPDDERMQAMMRVWDKTTLAERQAFHRVCCLNSRAPADLVVMNAICTRFQKEDQTHEI